MTSSDNTTPKQPKGKGFISMLSYWLAVGLGSGLAPKAPGTFGTLASLPFFFLFLLVPFWASVGIILVAFAAGIAICNRASEDMGIHDSGHIVWDEWVGQWVALLPLIYMGNDSFIFITVGFLLFRGFDILKPFPISYLDKKVHGGFGIMLDDVIAGVFSAVCLTTMIYVLWQ